jgi:nitrile hydratase accessory protein
MSADLTGHELEGLLGRGVAPPRANGELVFERPWQGRAFGMALALNRYGAFEWDNFKDSLIVSIGAWEAEHGERDERFRYYEHWLVALESALRDAGRLDDGRLAYQLERLTALDQHH